LLVRQHASKAAWWTMPVTSMEMTQLNKGPQFPAADHHSVRLEGAKNHRGVSIGCGALYIATYNARSLLGESRLTELENELAEIKWHIVGLSETRRHGETIEQLKSGHVLYTVGNDKSDGGVGFIINRSLADNVVEYKSASNRAAMIVIKLSKRYSLKVIQVYAPSTSHDDEEVEEFYENVNTLMDCTRTHFTMIIGDFNAKIGKQKHHEEDVMGKHGIGERNERGDRLIEFAGSRKMYIANGKFQKKESRMWTWQSPDASTRNQIDFIMTNKKDTIMNVDVINKVNTGSDHRMVRSKVKFGIRVERLKLVKNKRPMVDYVKLHANKAEFQIQLRNRFSALDNHSDDVNSYNRELTQIVVDTAYSIAGCKKQHQKVDKLTDSTRQLLKRRREMKPKLQPKDKIEYVELCKTIRKQMREEIRKYNVDVVAKALAENRGMKSVRANALYNKKRIVALKAEDGSIITDRRQILGRCADFYRKLYSSNVERPNLETSTGEHLPPVMTSEVDSALKHMKRNKAPGPDGIMIDTIKEGGSEVTEQLARLFTSCIKHGSVPQIWNNAAIILLHKKGDTKDISNYRPISLISHISKLFSKVLLQRIEKVLDENQTREQAGFRKGFSTTDHLQAVNQIVEKCNEYSQPLCMAFVDYEKAFDSVEHTKIMASLQTQGVDAGYIELLSEIYNNASSTISLESVSEEFKIQRGVRQGDTISPKLFNAGLEEVFRRLAWDGRGVNINGEKLNNLRFADDIVLMSNDVAEMQEMLNELNQQSMELGLSMNMKKTKVMFNEYTAQHEVKVNNHAVEHVQEYTYLGQLVSMSTDKTDEIKRRIAAAWRTFGKYRDILTGKIPMCLKRKVYNQCIQPALIYGCQTWALTKRMQDRLRTTQRCMERIMLGITKRDRKTVTWIRQQTGLQDIVVRIKQQKWQWAGHLARTNDNRWTKRVTEWIPLDAKRKRARPKTRWEDEIVKSTSATWSRIAQDKVKWHQHGEAFIQQWM
jgi:hypothetical protein